MSRPCLGTAPMSSAERQTRRRARRRQQRPASPAAPTRRLAPPPARWAAAVATLIRRQEEYNDGVIAITAAQLGYMLEGIDWRNPLRSWRPHSSDRGATS